MVVSGEGGGGCPFVPWNSALPHLHTNTSTRTRTLTVHMNLQGRFPLLGLSPMQKEYKPSFHC